MFAVLNMPVVVVDDTSDVGRVQPWPKRPNKFPQPLHCNPPPNPSPLAISLALPLVTVTGILRCIEGGAILSGFTPVIHRMVHA